MNSHGAKKVMENIKARETVVVATGDVVYTEYPISGGEPNECQRRDPFADHCSSCRSEVPHKYA
jgi:hypothetical protein